jgi:hypothetical protein
MGFVIFLVIVGLILLEWLIGKAIGNAVTKDTGIVLGIVLILCGISLIIGITIIVYSNKNERERSVNVNVNINKTDDTIRPLMYGSYDNTRNINHNANYISSGMNERSLIQNGQLGGSDISSNYYTDQKKCPFCAELIKKEAIICRFCGNDVKRYEMELVASESKETTFESKEKISQNGFVIGNTYTINKITEMKPDQDIFRRSINILEPGEIVLLLNFGNKIDGNSNYFWLNVKANKKYMEGWISSEGITV